jgi:hypothetical protein
VQGVLFARNRGHHALAAPVEYSRDAQAWVWRDADFFPDPVDDHHENAQMRRCYVAHLQGKPALVVLDLIEAEVRTRLDVT